MSRCSRRRARDRPCERPPWRLFIREASSSPGGGALAVAVRAVESSARTRCSISTAASFLAGAPYSTRRPPSRSSSISRPGRASGSKPAATAAAAAAAPCPAAIPETAAAAAVVRAHCSSLSASSWGSEPAAPNSWRSWSRSIGSETTAASSRPISAARGAVAVSRLPDCGSRKRENALQH